MSFAQNFSYSLVQLVHNLGSIAVVGGSLAGIVLKNSENRKTLAGIALAGWGVQGISGAAFGLASYFYYQRFPEITGIAVVSLIIKMICTAVGFVLLAAYFFKASNWSDQRKNGAWIISSALALVAMSAAAFLRWFS